MTANQVPWHDHEWNACPDEDPHNWHPWQHIRKDSPMAWAFRTLWCPGVNESAEDDLPGSNPGGGKNQALKAGALPEADSLTSDRGTL